MAKNQVLLNWALCVCVYGKIKSDSNGPIKKYTTKTTPTGHHKNNVNSSS